ncbi:hypothetical protein K439DRAFT_1307129, partial [Ramaria rubella]
ILYAANVFCRPIRKVSGKQGLTDSVGFSNRLARAQCMATLTITGTMRFTATDLLDADADLKPICHCATVHLATPPPDHPLSQLAQNATNC